MMSIICTQIHCTTLSVIDPLPTLHLTIPHNKMSRRKKRKVLFQEIHPDNEPLLDLAVSIVTKQLHNMPRDYVDTLIGGDCLHYNTLLMSDSSLRTKDKTIGCIVFRLYPEYNFTEIAFCCILTKFQGKGYGKELMKGLLDKLAQFDIQYALTYADKDSVGYFEKQGFEMGFEAIPRPIWYPRIFHYHGAHIMSIDRNEIVLKIVNLRKRSITKIGNGTSSNTTKHLFASCLNTESFQTQYNITAPPHVITDTKSAEYKNITADTPSQSKMSPNANWRSQIPLRFSMRIRTRKSMRNSTHLTPQSALNQHNQVHQLPGHQPPHKKRKLNRSTKSKSKQNTISHQQQEGLYKVVGIEEYDIIHTHYHATRYRESRECNRNQSSLSIKLNYLHHPGWRYRLPFCRYQQITSCIEREYLKGSNPEDIVTAVTKIWKLTAKFVRKLMAEMEHQRDSKQLYHALPITLQSGCCLLLPFNESDSSWTDLQIFKFEFEDGFGHLWGYNLLQSTHQTLRGKPNVFGTFAISKRKINVIRKEDTKLFVKPFVLHKKGRNTRYMLPDGIIQELYQRDYPQFRYCFKSSNPLFRAFICGIK